MKSNTFKPAFPYKDGNVLPGVYIPFTIDYNLQFLMDRYRRIPGG